ncbi:MAG TPA: TRZ/ATZ family hydrolase [Casimicrobiaceae bacterium]|nr:TRZ/ATZ family hydrolase [Casimicrobiaceae bacterium]
MRHIDLALFARWIIPIEPAGVLERHAVLVDGGKIVAVVPEDVVAQHYLPRDRITLDTHALIPGLVNAHAHTAMTLLRGIADDVALDTWLRDHIWPRESKHVTPAFVNDGVMLGAAEMLRGGVTCCNDMYFYPDAAARSYQAIGLRAVLGLPVLDFPTPYAADADGYLQAGLAARDAFKNAPRLSFMFAPHAPYTVGDATFERILTYARELDLPIQTHLQETRRELDESIAATGASQLARLDRLGVTGPSFVAVHAVHLAPGDIELLARHGCHVAHCPTSNLKLASGIAPVAKLRRAGVNVALGTDGAASNNRQDLMSELRLAALLAKVESGDAATLPAGEALAMATIDGARALGLDSDVGSLIAGKCADIVAIDLSALDDAPVYDPVSHLVHVASRDRVSDVWIDGERVVHDRRLTRVDEASLRSRAVAWQQRLA